MKSLALSIMLLLSCFALCSQEESQEKKTSFLKQLDLVIGGSLSVSNAQNPHVADFANSPFQPNPFMVSSNTQYITQSEFINPQIYGGIKIGKLFLIGLEYEFSDSKNVLDYGPLFGNGTVYIFSRQNRLDRKGIFARYYIPITERFQFGIQPSASMTNVVSDYEVNIATSSGSSDQLDHETFEYLEFGLSANVVFKVFDRFNILVQFGNTSYRNGDWSVTTTTYSDGILNEETISNDGNFEKFDFNFNASSIFFGLEIVL